MTEAAPKTPSSKPSGEPARPPSRLTGHLVRAAGDAVVSAAVASAARKPAISLSKGRDPRTTVTAPSRREIGMNSRPDTWYLRLGNHGSGVGDLATDGFEARNSNRSSGQDAIAVSGRRFAVGDGLGGSRDHDGTGFFSRYITHVAVEQGVDGFFDPTALRRICAESNPAFELRSGRELDTPSSRSALVAAAATTLTFAEVLAPGKVRLVIIGDSPAWVLGPDKKIIRQYGEDAQSGGVDEPLAFKLAIPRPGVDPIVPDRATAVGGRRIVDEVVDVPDGGLVVLGTDYFSDTVAAGGRFGQLTDFIGVSPDRFHTLTQVGKPDDSSLITIDPARIAAQYPVNS